MSTSVHNLCDKMSYTLFHGNTLKIAECLPGRQGACSVKLSAWRKTGYNIPSGFCMYFHTMSRCKAARVSTVERLSTNSPSWTLFLKMFMYQSRKICKRNHSELRTSSTNPQRQSQSSQCKFTHP